MCPLQKVELGYQYVSVTVVQIFSRNHVTMIWKLNDNSHTRDS